MIAAIAAVPFETELLRRHLSPCEVRRCGRRDLFRGSMYGHSVSVLHAGVGKTNAAAATVALLETWRPSAVIVLGCGGAYPGSGLEVGDLALATEEIYGDEGTLTPEGFRDMEFLGLPLAQTQQKAFYNRFPVDGRLLEKARPLLLQTMEAMERKLAAGPFVTVSCGSGTDRGALEMAQRTAGICENMEGAAVAHLCAQYGTPFLEFRGISNATEDRDTSRWDLKEGALVAQLAFRALLGGWNGGKKTA